MADQEARDDIGWNVKETVGAAGCIALVIFLAALFSTDEWSTRFSNAGQAVGAIAGAAALIAVLYTSHQLDLQRQAMKDQAVTTAAQLDLQRQAMKDQAVTTAAELDLQRQAMKDEEQASRAEHRVRAMEELRRAYAQLLADMDAGVMHIEGVVFTSSVNATILQVRNSLDGDHRNRSIAITETGSLRSVVRPIWP